MSAKTMVISRQLGAIRRSVLRDQVRLDEVLRALRGDAAEGTVALDPAHLRAAVRLDDVWQLLDLAMKGLVDAQTAL